jgi:hypothetical protein
MLRLVELELVCVTGSNFNYLPAFLICGISWW